MTAPNPFVSLAQDPIGFFGWLGYALFLCTVVILSTAGVARLVISIYVDVARDSQWPVELPSLNTTASRWKWVPPGWTVGKAAAIPFILGVVAWAVGGLLFLLAP